MFRRKNAMLKRPQGGDTIPLVVRQTLRIPAKPMLPSPINLGPQLLNYLGKPKKIPKSEPKRSIEIVKKRSAHVGQYIGDGKNLIAFVWLDDATESVSNDHLY